MSILDKNCIDQMAKPFLLGRFFPEKLQDALGNKAAFLKIARACGYYKSTSFYKKICSQAIDQEFIKQYYGELQSETMTGPLNTRAYEQVLMAFYRAIKIKEQKLDPLCVAAYGELARKIKTDAINRKIIILNDDSAYKQLLVVDWVTADRFSPPQFQLHLIEWINSEWRYKSMTNLKAINRRYDSSRTI